MRPFHFLLISFILLISACKEQSTVAVAKYSCEDNRVITTTFRDGTFVDIVDGDISITLKRVESASGAKYEGEGTVFWSKGIDAVYEPKPGMQIGCRRG